MTHRLNYFLAPNTFEEILCRMALLGMVAHLVVIFVLSAFFPDIYKERMGNYLFRFLDPSWWMLWFIGMLLCVKSGMFNYQRYAWGIAAGLVGSLLSLIPTIVWGLATGAYVLMGSFILIGICIALNQVHSEKAA